MYEDSSPNVWLSGVITAMFISGGFFLLGGITMSSPTLYGMVTSLQGSLLGSAVAPVDPGYAPGAPQSVFIAATLLLIGAAFLDVWRRMRHLNKK